MAFFYELVVNEYLEQHVLLNDATLILYLERLKQGEETNYKLLDGYQ